MIPYDSWRRLLEERVRYKGQAKRSGTPLYRMWKGFRARCYNPNTKSYPDYGARGITVCPEWLHDYPTFKAWALANGYAGHLQIDRRDNSQGYSPENCRFVTRKVQCRNRRSNILVTAFGETKTVTEWSEDPRCPISYYGLRARFLKTPNAIPENAIVQRSMKAGIYCNKGHLLEPYKGRKRCPTCVKADSQKQIDRAKMKAIQQGPAPL